MFLPSNERIRTEIELLMAEDPVGPTKLAVAFWGTGADRFLQGECRIICDLLSGACNPKTIAAIRARPSCLVFHLDKLHAKVVLNRAGAIVSSANMSSNGLGIEGLDSYGTFEAGYRIEPASNSYEEVSAWFEQMWARARPVTAQDLSRAQLLYDAKNHAATTKIPVADYVAPDIFRPIAADQLLKEEIDPDNRVRSVKEFVLGITNEVLPGLGRGAQGKVATFACHAILCRSGSELAYSSSGSDPGGKVTEDWIAGRFYMNGKETRTRVEAVLDAMTRRTIVPAAIRHVAAEVLATPAWDNL